MMQTQPAIMDMDVLEYGANYVILMDKRTRDQTLFSYGVPIAMKTPNNFIYLYPDYAYSVTTGKHRNAFLGCDLNDLKQRIKNKKAALLPFLN